MANKKKDISKRSLGSLLFLIAIPACIIAFNYPEICNGLILVFSIGMTLFLVFLGFKLDKHQKRKLYIFLFITWVSIGFGALFVMMPTVLTLFIERNVARVLMGVQIPTPAIMAINSLVIMTLGPFLAFKNKQIKSDGAAAIKFGYGIFLMGAGYIALVLGIYFNNQGLTALIWVVLCYVIQAIAELYVNPIGYSLSHSLAPEGMEASLLGFFQLGSGVASVVMGYFSTLASKLQGQISPVITNTMYLHAFVNYGSISILLGIFAMIVLWVAFGRK